MFGIYILYQRKKKFQENLHPYIQNAVTNFLLVLYADNLPLLTLHAPYMHPTFVSMLYCWYSDVCVLALNKKHNSANERKPKL